MISRFIIYKPNRDHYYTAKGDLNWTAYIEKATPYKTYEEASAVLETLPPGFYQIDKIFKV
jgi:hypothetical protein